MMHGVIINIDYFRSKGREVIIIMMMYHVAREWIDSY